MTALMIATQDSHHDILHHLLMVGAYKDVKNAKGQTALMMSIEKGMYKCFNTLLQAGASTSMMLTNRDGQTALMLAAANSDSRYVEALMQTIIARDQFSGLNLSKRDKCGKTALMIAAERGLTSNLEILIRPSAEIKTVKGEAELPLVYVLASLAGHENCARLLVQNRARFYNDGSDQKVLMTAVVSDIVKAQRDREINVHYPDELGRTLLHWAAGAGKEDCVAMLLQCGANLNQTDQQGNTALMTAIAPHGHDKSICSVYCDVADEFSDKNKKLQCLRLLINAGADLNKVNHEGKSAIMLAAESKEDADGEYLNLLLNSGGNDNLQDNKGETALMKASAAGNVKHVQTLLQFGANLHSDVNVQDEDGMTALMMTSSKGMEETVQTLFDCGATVNLKDHSGKTALMHVTDKIKLDNVSIVTNKYKVLERRSGPKGIEYASVVKKLVDHGSDVNMKDENGMTTLMMACAGKKEKITCTLLECGADVNLQDNTGKTALMHLMIQNQFYEDDSDYRSSKYKLPSVVDQLVAHGADINMRDVKGMTAVMYAAAGCESFESLNLICALAGNHACLDLLDNEGKSALVHALEKDNSFMTHVTVVRLLSKGAFPRVKVTNTYYPPTPASLLSFFRNVPVSLNSEFTEAEDITRLLVSNGIMPIKKIMYPWNYHEGTDSREKWCPLLQTLYQDFDDDVDFDPDILERAKYLVANCYMSSTDMKIIRSGDELLLDEDVEVFLINAVSNPWPLVKLAQIAVSTAIGPSPGRRERILQTGLPRPIMDCLMFDRPIALLHKNWGDIPMCFDPVQYSLQPVQYPLLQYWPFGHYVELCDCRICARKEEKFRLTKIVVMT